jgi:hypothetical protein
LNNPTATLFDSSGNLWVVDSINSRILEFKPPFSDGMKASLVIGAKGFATSGGPIANDTLRSPGAAAFDSKGDLWVIDTWNNRVLEYVPPFADGMGASLVIGQPGFATRYSSVSRNGLGQPFAIAFDSTGSMWVYDANRVLEYNHPFRNGMNASLVLGEPDFQSSIVSTTLNRLGPIANGGGSGTNNGGLAVDSYSDVWVGDPGNNRILEFRPPFTNGMNASFVIDQRNLVANKTSFAGHGLVTSPSGPNLGTVLAFDSQGNLWASYNNRILVFKPPFLPEIRSFPTLEIGQPNFTATTWLGGQAGFFNPGQPSFDPRGDIWVPDSYNNRILEFVASHAADVTGQSFWGLGSNGLVVVAVAIVGAVGALLIIWLRRVGGPS